MPKTVWKRTTYAPLDWQTHPIDTVQGPQGWGPFYGPYSPLDYPDPATCMAEDGISIGYNADPYVVTHGPGYHDLTLFSDPSLDVVNAVLRQAVNSQSSQGGKVYTNTIAQAFKDTNTTGSVGAAGTDLLSRLRAALAK